MNAAPPVYKNPEFDAFADDYDAALEKGISVSGEGKEYFAEGRVHWLGGRLRELAFSPGKIMDFGCGTGSATPFLKSLPGLKSLVGVEVSANSLRVAERLHGGPQVQFRLAHDFCPEGEFDLAFCNGVFHHIPPADRPAALKYIHQALRPGGLFALWENNPWNPGTRLVMSRIPFDRDAVTLSALEARKLLRAAGFEIISTHFLFLFPRFLRVFRPAERWVARLPLGAQYQVLGRKQICG